MTIFRDVLARARDTMHPIHAALAAMALAFALGSALCSAPAALHAAEIRSSAAASRAEDALTTLASHVSRQSHPGALRRAFHAYYSFQTAHPEQVRKPYLYFVDFGLDNLTPRGYIFDMVALRLIDGPFTVAHGRGSAPGAAAVPTRFSNIRSSYMTSLGLYLTEETYAFSGSASGRRYRSIGLRLRGLSGPFNSAARVRGIVVHGAPYVTSTRAGRSEGCPAMEESRAQWLLPRISNGALVFLFSPNDEVWMRNDPWVRGGVGPLAASGR